MEEKKRGKLKIAVSLFVIILILISAVFLFIKERTKTNAIVEESSPPFKVDQILLKVLIKDDESMARPINIMDISDYDLYVEIEPQNLYDIVSVSDSKFALKTGQTKTVYLNFTSFVKEANTKQEPGVYIGNLLTKGNSNTLKTPIIVEIETKEILFDSNVEIPIEQKQIEQGDYLNTHITLFNLKRIGLTNLNMEYFVNDISGNIIITETESITIETQASFVKTIHIPKNLNPGEYVFGAVARYGSSVGTSTVLFEVTSLPPKKRGMLDYYRGNEVFFFVLLIILAIIVSFIGSHISFLIGLFVHDRSISLKEKPQKIRVKEKEERKIVKKRVKYKGIKHKKLFLALSFLVIILSAILAIVLLGYGALFAKQLSAFFSNTAVKISECGKGIANSSSDLWNNTKPLLSNAYKNSLNWLKNIGEKAAPYIRDLWRSILYYASPQRRYFYHTLGLIISLAAIICFIATAKKTHLFERLKAKLKQRKAEKKLKEETRPKDVTKEKAKIWIFKNFKKLSKKEKIIILIMLLILLLIILISILIELGIVSAQQLSIKNLALKLTQIIKRTS